MTEALSEQGRRYVPLNAVDDGEGQQAFAAAGSPTVPALMFDGEVFSFQHPSQISSLLELDLAQAQRATGVAWSMADVLERWLDVIVDVPFEALLTPTESRGRDIRNLTVNVFRPVSYLPSTWDTHEFWWYTGEADLQQEAFLRTAGEVHGFARDVLIDLHSFLADRGDELSESDPPLTGNRGAMTYSTLLQTQRFHAAFHYRQIVDHLAREGVTDKAPLPEAMVREIGLPENLY